MSPMVDVGGGVQVNLVERGAGRPILFVHGWPTNSTAWERQLEALSGDHHVLALDLPGYGDSPPLARPTVAAYAGAVKGLLDARGLDGVLLIGWSLGGLTVMSYCEQFGSHRLRAIGIVDVSPKPLPGDGWPQGQGTPFSHEGLGAWASAWDADPRSVAMDVYTIGLKDPEKHAAERERLVEESLRADHGTAMAGLLDAMHGDFRESLQRLDVPALLLYGAHSTSTTPYVREFMRETIPRAQLVVFDESSHSPMLEETEKFNRAVDGFARAVA